ncbi:MAG TPA: divalent-cation tolerance protein CutA [Novosphingobium sp.]|nr:divalent-cation tolerance protein CutA [Novosphingobium sp.]
MSAPDDRGIAALIWCPFPDGESARQVAGALIDEKLVACANILPGMLSLFSWNGRREEADEAGVLFKTNAGVLDEAIARLTQLHPYDEPAILGWRCDAAAPGTLAWLAALGARP